MNVNCDYFVWQKTDNEATKNGRESGPSYPWTSIQSHVFSRTMNGQWPLVTQKKEMIVTGVATKQHPKMSSIIIIIKSALRISSSFVDFAFPIKGQSSPGRWSAAVHSISAYKVPLSGRYNIFTVALISNISSRGHYFTPIFLTIRPVIFMDNCKIDPISLVLCCTMLLKVSHGPIIYLGDSKSHHTKSFWVKHNTCQNT